MHYYNRHKFHYLAVTWHEEHGRVLSILSCPGDWPHGKLQFPLEKPVALPGDGVVDLAMNVDGADLRFFYKVSGEDWRPVGPVLDASVISDEGGRGEHASFTGAFTGMAAFDTSGSVITADFDRFAYIPMDE